MRIHQLKLRVSNAYLILDQRPVLVDTGSPGEIETVREKLQQFSVELSDLSLIVHTHAHSDHMGSTAAIAEEAKCPIAYHPADQPIIDRGHNGRLNGVSLRGKIMSRFFSNSPFDSVKADVDLKDGSNLSECGADLSIISTPGHTSGSVSFLTPHGDAIIGDVIMGGYMGGNFRPSKPNDHYFAHDFRQTMTSLDEVLDRTTGLLYVGHGGPLSCKTVRNWRGKQSKFT